MTGVAFFAYLRRFRFDELDRDGMEGGIPATLQGAKLLAHLTNCSGRGWFGAIHKRNLNRKSESEKFQAAKPLILIQISSFSLQHSLLALRSGADVELVGDGPILDLAIADNGGGQLGVLRRVKIAHLHGAHVGVRVSQDLAVEFKLPVKWGDC
jgi:hypothetical protein